VGFIQKLPTALVEAFHATLEEITEADLLLHVVDISHPNALAQYEAVQQTVQGIGASHIPMVTALNKVDRLKDPAAAQAILQYYPQATAISAINGTGIRELIEKIKAELYENYTPIDVWLPYQEGQLISSFHESGQIDRIEHGRGGVQIYGRIPGRLVAQFKEWQASHPPKELEDIHL
jgi:GTP-binding protein HflX